MSRLSLGPIGIALNVSADDTYLTAAAELEELGQALFPRIRDWLRPGGYFLAITGATRWTGTEQYHGAGMFWDHADTDTYLRWFQAARLTPLWHRSVAEGNSGHTLILARAR